MKRMGWIILEAAVVVILLVALVSLAVENERLRLMFGPYTVGNFKNYRRIMLTRDMPMYNDVAQKYGVSAYTLASIGIKENLNDLYSHGVKLIPAWAVSQDPRTWQAEACAKIVREEILKYIYEDDARLKELYIRLGKRYCEKDKAYGLEIFAIHKQIQAQEVKK